MATESLKPLLSILIWGELFSFVRGVPFSVSRSYFALVVFTGWIYVVGLIYALVRNWLQPHAKQVSTFDRIVGKSARA